MWAWSEKEYSVTNEWGRMELTQQTNYFSVSHKKGVIVFFVFCLLFFGASLLDTINRTDESADVRHYLMLISLGFLLVFFLYQLAHCLRWKLTVREDAIIIKDISGKEKLYPIRQITRVTIEDRPRKPLEKNILLFVSGKKIAKVSSVGFYNFAALCERLKRDGIPFYENDTLISPLELEQRMLMWFRRSRSLHGPPR